MTITRTINNEKIQFELTPDELYNAHTEHVITFMKNVLVNDFNCSEDVANNLADLSYDEYCKGDGLTEYECIEKIYSEYSNS